MNILDRYFLREFLKPLGACLLAFLLCMVVHDLFDNLGDFTKARTPPEVVLQYYAILVPAYLVDIMPIALLLALLHVLSRMSKHGELTAMRSGGINFTRLLAPCFAIGVLMSGVMLALSLGWAPEVRYKARVLFRKNTDQKEDGQEKKTTGIAYRDVRGNRFWFITSLDLKRNEAAGIELVQTDENQKDLRRISARLGVYEEGRWILRHVVIYDYTKPVEDPECVRRLDELDGRELGLTEPPKQLMMEYRKPKRISTRELLENLRYASRLSPRQHAIYATEFHARIAQPAANFVVFLIGVPFGVVGQRRSAFLAVANALGLFFAYLFLAHVLSLIGQAERLPAWLAAWLPNLIFAGIGMALIRRIR